MHAWGKSLFLVHREPCAQLVHSGVRVTTNAALLGVRELMRRKAPTALRLVEAAAKLYRVRRELEHEAQESNP